MGYDCAGTRGTYEGATIPIRRWIQTTHHASFFIFEGTEDIGASSTLECAVEVSDAETYYAYGRQILIVTPVNWS